MGDFLVDWNDSSMSLDSPNNGIPIPRNQHSQPYLRPDFGSQSYLYDNDSSSPSRPPLVPPNSLVMNGSNISSQFSFPLESQRIAFSPNSVGSPLMPSNNVDLSMEIKMEPLEELLDIGGMINPNESHPPEDNLLDNVNFEDLLMTNDMDSSTTCLDPQHSSPAAMATVHPDEVLGLIRSDTYSSHPTQSFTPSLSVPVKVENVSFGGLATSFPPQGIGWKEPIQNQCPPNHSLYQTLDNPQQNNHQRNFSKGSPSSNQHLPRLLPLSQEEFSPQQNAHHRADDHLNPSYNNNEPLYTQLESASSTTNSALHDLLVNSPRTSHSPHQQQLSPPNSNVSPVSPLRGIPQDIPIGQSVPGIPSFLTATSSNFSSRLSSSAPVNNFSLEQIWQRREPRQRLLSTGSLAEEVGGSTSSLSTGGGILSPIPHDLSIDEGIDSDDDSDVEHYDSDSDNDSIMSEELTSLGGHSGKKERHFWQYNVQAKGPKGQRVNITQDETNPHNLAKIMDPVFSPLCSIQGIKHSGKARRGDGNDLTPSPRKLVSIGLELSKLNKKINDMTPVSELPSTVRSKSRKEKNKLASRACRLKKKAQHEANKIKLYGLEQEHKGMLSLISKMRDELLKKVDIARASSTENSRHDSSPNDSFLSFGSPEQRIAGFTTEFVNKVIENCRSGNPTGGLDELSQTFGKSTTFANELSNLNPNNELYT